MEPPAKATIDQHYDYRRFGRHRLRTPNGAIIDLPMTVVEAAQVWVATIWPDTTAQAAWARQLWLRDQIGRGWMLPVELAGGDVVEFGADTPSQPVRWYGVLHAYDLDRWTTVQGPYRNPADAWNDAQIAFPDVASARALWQRRLY